MIKRNIKFPLIMKNGTEVRTLDELRENFDVESVVNYFLDAKLNTWLQHRGYDCELERVESLKNYINRKEIPVKLCEVFGVEVKDDFDIERIEQRKLRLVILEKYTDDESWVAKLDYIAFSQEEMIKMLSYISQKEGKTEIYLCGKEFVVSDEFKNITYTGVNKPVIKLVGNEMFDAKAKNIKFLNVSLSEHDSKRIISDKSMANDSKKQISTVENLLNELTHKYSTKDLEMQNAFYNLDASYDGFNKKSESDARERADNRLWRMYKDALGCFELDKGKRLSKELSKQYADYIYIILSEFKKDAEDIVKTHNKLALNSIFIEGVANKNFSDKLHRIRLVLFGTLERDSYIEWDICKLIDDKVLSWGEFKYSEYFVEYSELVDQIDIVEGSRGYNYTLPASKLVSSFIATCKAFNKYVFESGIVLDYFNSLISSLISDLYRKLGESDSENKPNPHAPLMHNSTGANTSVVQKPIVDSAMSQLRIARRKIHEKYAL